MVLRVSPALPSAAMAGSAWFVAGPLLGLLAFCAPPRRPLPPHTPLLSPTPPQSRSCTILVHPATQEAHPAAVQRALDGLAYGTVSQNAWSALAFTVPQVGGLASCLGACEACRDHLACHLA